MGSLTSFSKPFGILLVLLLSISGSAGAGFYTDATQLPTTEYDFIVVGAGNAGNVIASRLTEDTKTTVLVIEAGISDKGVVTVAAPNLALKNLPFSPVTWNYTTVPQPALDNRAIDHARGKIIGGSSSVNFMAYTRGANDEYDRWANLTGDPGWAWKNMEQFYFRNERLVPPRDGHNTFGEVNPAAHGFGTVPISLAGTPNPLDPRMLASTRAPESQFPFRLDMNAGDTIGFGIVQSTVNHGERAHSGVAFLEPTLLQPNLHVLIENKVTRLLQTSFGINPRFNKVEFARDANSKHYVVTAKKEVVLSAGSVNTPQILMLSGIGDPAEIGPLGINVTVNLPDVGKHLKDHPIVANYFSVNSNQTYDDVLRNPTAALTIWTKNRTGPLVATPATALGFFRLPKNDTIFRSVPDPSAGPGAGHMELILSNDFVPEVELQPATGNFMTINSVVVSPTSTGSVTLNSSDPFAFPVMNPNFLSTALDQHVMVQVIRAARTFLTAAPWKAFVVAPTGIVGSAGNSDDEILAAARQVAVSIWHPVCTARMSPKGATFGVLDPDLRVKGVSGLRVVDGSAILEIPAVHPMAHIYLLAERRANLIKSSWKLQ